MDRQKSVVTQPLDKELTGVEDATSRVEESVNRVMVKMEQIVSHSKVSMRIRFGKEFDECLQVSPHQVKHVFNRKVMGQENYGTMQNIGWEYAFYKDGEHHIYRIFRMDGFCTIWHKINGKETCVGWTEDYMRDMQITMAILLNADSVHNIYFE